MQFFNPFIKFFNLIALGYYFLAHAVYSLILTLSAYSIGRHVRRGRHSGHFQNYHPSVVQPVSVLIAAYNEEAGIVNTVNSLLELQYPSYEIIVISDGSLDGTLQRLIEAFSLEQMDLIYRPIIPTARVKGFYINPGIPNLTVIDKEHSGKADSLNVGINVSRSSFFCSVDADSIIEKDALTKLMAPIVDYPDLIRAAGGIVKVINGCAVEHGRIIKVGPPKQHLVRFQIVEYIRGFLFGRVGWSTMNMLMVLSGTFSLLHKKTVQEVRGYSTDTVAEDMELVVKIHKHMLETGSRYRVAFVPDPICWTEVPSTAKMLARQRRRWQTGLLECVWKYRSMVFNPRYKMVGFLAMPYQVLFEVLGGPIEFFAYPFLAWALAMNIIGKEVFMLFLFLAITVGIFFSVTAILLEELIYERGRKYWDMLMLVFYAVFENLGYRQLTAFWRTTAVMNSMLKRRKGWEVVKKSGDHIAERRKDIVRKPRKNSRGLG